MTLRSDFGVQRNTIIAGAAAILVAVVAFLAWRHITDLGDRLVGLSGQVEELGNQVVVAEKRATEAEARAEEAQREAGSAAQSAAEAATREQESAEQAKQSETARKRAEEREQRASADRQQAELLAQAAEAERQQAEARELVAEKERAEAQRVAETARAEAAQSEAEKQELERRLEGELNRMQRALGRIADTRRTALGVVMTLDSSQIEFDFNKAELRPGNREVLSRIAGVLLTFDDYGLQIFGHTDNIGSVEYNQQLSKQRAGAVREYLAKVGVSPDVMTITGMGKSSPLVEGNDPESLQRNRRVELAIVFSEGDFDSVD